MLWWFKDKDVKLAALEIWNDECTGFIIPDESPAKQPGLLKTLCDGIAVDLMAYKIPFSKYKRFFINDYHFEKGE